MPNYQIDEMLINLKDPKVGDKIKSSLCPYCDEDTLIVQEQEGRYGHEYYIECDNESCGSCFYPIRKDK